MKHLSLENIDLDHPDDWDGRLFKYDAPPGAGTPYPTAHIGSFTLPDANSTGSFGSGAAAVMSTDDAFVTLLEYVVDDALQPGVGLFADTKLPRGLAGQHFSDNQLQVIRPPQVGAQRFFTYNNRPFCLYVILGSPQAGNKHLSTVNAILNSLKIAARAR